MLNIHPTVAERLGRKWIGIDIEKQAIQITENRINKQRGLYER
jgi:DNA modification methylase